ncbi:MAG: TonB-dependent receptor [Bacteroidales bacterium]|nr:TonB-dependent receptor [Bacteroidales bacterium]
MRFTFLLCTVLSLNVSAIVLSQSGEMEVDVEDLELRDLIREIENKSEFAFFFNDDYSDLNSKVSVRYKGKRINDLMDKMLANTTLGYKILDNNFVVIVPKNQAEQVEITGVVTDQEGMVLPGVNVIEKGVSNGSVTNMQGEFTITVSKDATLVFSYVGYLDEEVVVGTRTAIDVTLIEDIQSLDEVVVIGYGSMKRSDLTGAIGSISSEDMTQGSTSSPEELIQGKLAGVQVITADGQPGGASRIRVRGVTSIRAGNDPLYVIDGVPFSGGTERSAPSSNSSEGPSNRNAANYVETNPMSFINPADIESINVLKGPSATAIYGSRAANGVVIITTKSGEANQGFVTFDMKLTSNTALKTPKALSAQQYKDKLTEWGIAVDDGGTETDWVDEIFRTGNSKTYSLSAGGGSGNSTIYGSFNYQDELGMIIGSGFDKIGARVNVSQTVADERIKLDMGVNYSTMNWENSNVYNNNGGGVLGSALRYNPTYPVYDSVGNFNEYAGINRDLWNPVAYALQPVDELTRDRLVANAKLEFRILKSLKLESNGAINNTASYRNIFYPKDSQIGAPTGYAYKQSNKGKNLLWENFLTFDKEFASVHKLNAVLGYSYEIQTNEGQDAEVQDILISSTKYYNMDGAATVIGMPGSFKIQGDMESYFGRLNYSYKSKYLFTTAFRSDYSSVFGPETNVASLPSVALAWRASEEEFLNSIGWLSNLKLRAEWGIAGSQSIPYYQALQTLSARENKYNMGSELGYVTMVQPDQYENRDLKWESSETTNIGFDYALFNSRLNGSFDYFIRNTSNLLLRYDVPAPSVIRQITDNVGEMRNTGYEFTLNAVLMQTSDLMFDVNLTFTHMDNEITAISNAEFNVDEIVYGNMVGRGFVGDNPFRLYEGIGIHTFYAFDFVEVGADGNEYFKNYEEDADGNIVAVVDDPVTEVREDLTDDPGEEDRQYFGSALPKFTFSITPSVKYKDFDLSIFLRGATGHRVLNNTAAAMGTPSFLAGGWNVYDGPVNDENVGPSSDFEYSDRFIEKADFLRVQNITLGYTANIGQLKWIKQARIYLSGSNLLLFTKYSGQDPEVYNFQEGTDAIETFGIDMLSYPKARSFTLGVNVTF